MFCEKKDLWTKTPGMCEETPTITAYMPDEKKSELAVVIFPGGGYGMRASHEGEGYAKFLAENGYTSFVIDYRVSPHEFPLPLLDARRAVRTVRHYAGKYGIDKNKIAVMGSSAGGHLAALCSTYFEPIDFEKLDEIRVQFHGGLGSLRSVPAVIDLHPDAALHRIDELVEIVPVGWDGLEQDPLLYSLAL